jgi:hypothetical protein
MPYLLKWLEEKFKSIGNDKFVLPGTCVGVVIVWEEHTTLLVILGI